MNGHILFVLCYVFYFVFFYVSYDQRKYIHCFLTVLNSVNLDFGESDQSPRTFQEELFIGRLCLTHRKPCFIPHIISLNCFCTFFTLTISFFHIGHHRGLVYSSTGLIRQTNKGIRIPFFPPVIDLNIVAFRAWFFLLLYSRKSPSALVLKIPPLLVKI